MAIEAWDYYLNFNGQANEAPWVEWTDYENSFAINTNGLRPNGFVAASAHYSDVFTSTPRAGFTITTNISASSDPLGIALFVADGANAGKGYIFWINGGTGSVRRRDTATGTGSNIGSPTTFALPTLTNGDEFWIEYSGGTITVYHNGVGVATRDDSTYQAEDFVAGVVGDAQNNNGRRIGAIGIDNLSSQTIDALGDGNTTVRVGGTHSVNTTGLGALTTASTIGGKAISSASAPSGDGTITLAGFVNGETYPAMGTVTCIMTDDTLSASVNRTLDTIPGWQWVTVAGLDRGEWSLGKAFAEDETPEQLHVIDDGVGILNPDGTLTEWPDTGTFGAWARMAAGGPYSVGEMVYFTFTVNSGGIVTGGSIVNFGTVSYGTVKYGIAE